jgi:PIN domain nuclease of toxin-antitoxin system
MRILLDTHAFLWWITNDHRLSQRSIELISDGSNELLFSAASGWEIAIKAGLGRLDVPDPLDRFVSEHLFRNHIGVLPMQLSHALHVVALPQFHRDPFDRLLVAQARVEGLSLLSSDKVFEDYDVDVLW